MGPGFQSHAAVQSEWINRQKTYGYFLKMSVLVMFMSLKALPSSL